MPELRFSVHEDAEGREAILQDITVPVPAEPSRKFGCVVSRKSGICCWGLAALSASLCVVARQVISWRNEARE